MFFHDSTTIYAKMKGQKMAVFAQTRSKLNFSKSEVRREHDWYRAFCKFRSLRLTEFSPRYCNLTTLVCATTAIRRRTKPCP